MVGWAGAGWGGDTETRNMLSQRGTLKGREGMEMTDTTNCEQRR